MDFSDFSSIFFTISLNFKIFWLLVLRNIKNSNIKNFSENGYVLKVLNSFDSKKSAFVEGQTQLSIFLSE